MSHKLWNPSILFYSPNFTIMISNLIQYLTAFPDLISFKTVSSSVIEEGSLFNLTDCLIFIETTCCFIIINGFMLGCNDLGSHSFRSKFLSSPGADTRRPQWLCFAKGMVCGFFGISFCLSFHIALNCIVYLRKETLDTFVFFLPTT